MTLIPFRKQQWIDPFRELEVLQDEMSHFFEHSLSKRGDKSTDLFERAWSPAADISETKESIQVKVDLPGMSKDEIQVSVQGDELVIKGEKKRESEVKEEDYLRSERAYGMFYRALTLPEGVDTGQVKAAYKNGVLELTLPKKEEAKPKQISIEVK